MALQLVAALLCAPTGVAHVATLALFWLIKSANQDLLMPAAAIGFTAAVDACSLSKQQALVQQLQKPCCSFPSAAAALI